MRLGGPVFEQWKDPQEFADLHLNNGYSAAYCPVVDDEILLQDIKHVLAESDIVIAENGWYGVNFLDTDPALRQRNSRDRRLGVFGAWHYNLNDVDRLLQVVASVPDQLDKLITHRMPMSKIQEAWELQVSRNCGKVILHPWE
ncbi:MAG: hypothetical protein ACYC27_05695 [Armatimonadota bacterium]